MHRKIDYEEHPGKTKAIGLYPACWVAVKRGVLERENEEVGYATGSHAIMRHRWHQKNKLAQGQVSCQAAATKMAVKFDLVRAGQNVECEIDSYTPLMVASHKFEPIYGQIAYGGVFVFMSLRWYV